MAQLPIAEADICIFQGATFNQTLFYETGEPSAPVNLAGFTAKMHIRSKPESKALILELSTSNGRIVLNEATGSIRLFISDSDTASLSVCDKAVYDLELYDTANNVTTRILQGNVIISPEVTR
jgi:tRNA A37 threonylcarbamoyltransferase TsaD